MLKKLSLLIAVMTALGALPVYAQQVGKPANSNAKSFFSLPKIMGKEDKKEGPVMNHATVYTPPDETPAPPVKKEEKNTSERPIAEKTHPTPLQARLRELGVDADAMEQAVFRPPTQTK